MIPKLIWNNRDMFISDRSVGCMVAQIRRNEIFAGLLLVCVPMYVGIDLYVRFYIKVT